VIQISPQENVRNPSRNKL